MSRHVVYTGRKIQLAVETQPLPDGQVTQREVVLHPGAVVILAFPVPGHVCLVRNRRAAVGQTLIELPAGTLAPPETPEAAAARELDEETGYRAARWRLLTEFYPSPGILSERMFLYLAEDLHPGRPHPDPGEEVEPLVVPWPEALAWALDGTIRDAKTLVGLLLWDKTRPG